MASNSFMHSAMGIDSASGSIHSWAQSPVTDSAMGRPKVRCTDWAMASITLRSLSGPPLPTCKP